MKNESKKRDKRLYRYSELVLKRSREGLTEEELSEIKRITSLLNMTEQEIMSEVQKRLLKGE